MINSMRNPKDKVEGQELLPQEIEDAEKRIISLLQLEAFSEEYMALLTGKVACVASVPVRTKCYVSRE